MTIRKTLFWVHLAAGLAAGLVIAIMCITGAALAFEKHIVAWAERDARQVAAPAASARLSLEQLRDRFAQTHPGRPPSALVVSRDPRDAVAFAVGRGETYYVDPADGTVRQPASTAVRSFLRKMNDWHRALARTGDSRATGRAITGAGNVAFLFLAISGAVLWWPRKWRTKGLKRSLWFLRDASGRARDWNWHNVVGFWFLPVLIVLTASGVVLSYRWAGDLVYRSVGEAPPAPGAGRRAEAGPGEIAPSSPEARPLEFENLLAVAQRKLPHWETLTLRLDDDPRRAGDSKRPTALITVKSSDAWPRTATTSLYLDPFSGTVLRREDFSALTPGRRARIWLRFLHTGEALGPAGQLVAGLGCLGGCLLVYTGFALAWRRFRGEEKRAAEVGPSGLG
jgi:uncharacterized iron-regulated membrane protein